MKAVVSSTADGLRTVVGTRATHHHGVTFAGLGLRGEGGLLGVAGRGCGQSRADRWPESLSLISSGWADRRQRRSAAWAGGWDGRPLQCNTWGSATTGTVAAT